MDIIGEVPAEAQENVRVLEEALEAAKKGWITSVAVLTASKGGFNVAVGGTQVADLMLAAEVFKAKIVEVYLDPSKNKGAPKSAILRPARGRG